MDSPVLSRVKEEQEPPIVDLVHPDVYRCSQENRTEGVEMDCKIPAVVKVEQPAGDRENQETNSSSTNCSSIAKQEHLFVERNHVKIVKQELSDTLLCEDNSVGFSSTLGLASCDSFQEKTGNPELRKAEKDSFSTVSCNKIVENVSSVVEVNRSPSLTNENLRFHSKVKHTEGSGRTHHFTEDISRNSQKQQTPYLSDGCDAGINEDTKIHGVDTCSTHSNCDVSFNEVSFLNPYKCDDCGASFTRNDQMTNHKRAHTGEKHYTCDVCCKSFAQASSLHYHKRKHSGERPYKCDMCVASFTRSDYLTRHKRTHTGEKPYECDVCGVSFTQASHVNRHKRTHTGEKPYKCDVCGALFTEAGSLNQHRRTHTGERPYKCDVCGVTFAKASNLNSHLKTHTGEKPYKCDMCSASFTKASNLNCHVRTHTGEKPYKCDVCGATFTRNDHLTYHKKKHARDTLPKK